MENHHAINGKIHYFDWAIFNSFLLVHQRVRNLGEFFGRTHWMNSLNSDPALFFLMAFLDLSLSLEGLYHLVSPVGFVVLVPIGGEVPGFGPGFATQELCEDPETSIVMDLVDEGPIKPPCREVTHKLPGAFGRHFLARKIRMSPTKIWVDRWFMIAKLVLWRG